MRGGKELPARSQAASVGIMQINQRVGAASTTWSACAGTWRTTSRAGAQILLRYLKDYAVPFAERTGDPEHVARAAYAVYNGGPRGRPLHQVAAASAGSARRREAVDALPRHRGRRRRGSRELQREGALERRTGAPPQHARLAVSQDEEILIGSPAFSRARQA